MIVRSLLTRHVATVGPEANAAQIVSLMREHKIGGLPVVDGEMRVLGMVSDGDLARGRECCSGGKRPNSWLDRVANPRMWFDDCPRAPSLLARDVMSSPVVTVDERATIGTIADVLDRHRIKRVPVIRDGRLVGLVTRADVVRLVAMVSRIDSGGRPTDEEIRVEVVSALQRQASGREKATWVDVENGVVRLQGTIGSLKERTATRVAVQTVPGVRRVEDRRSLQKFSVVR
jgi:CBS domain-containing protein